MMLRQRNEMPSWTRWPGATAILVAIWMIAGGSPALAQGTAIPGDCPPADLQVTLNTGWDQSTGGSLIPTGWDDDDWDVIVDASGGTTPRDADAINANPAWLTLPNSKWISAAATGPNGTYVYEMCWCMDDDATNPALNFQARADDEADFFLNGNPIGSAPAGSFNDTIPTIVSVTDPTLFTTGQNCLQAEVRNVFGVVTGFNLAGEVTADDGLCCACDSDDLDDEASTGIDDTTATLIPTGSPDDEWTVTASPSGGTLPRPADVINTFAGWNVIPGTKWISADENGPNGTYVYEKCWCMAEGFTNPLMTMDLLADDQANVFLNGNFLGSTGAGAFLFPATFFSAANPALFRAGENCLTVEVQNTQSVVTGMNALVQVTAANGECCDCFPLPNGAEGWWPLNETSGITAFESLNAYDGTHMETTATAPAPTPTPGMVGGALDFDGVDDYVNVPDTPGLNFGAGEDLSIDAWIRTTNFLRQAIVWKKGLGATLPGYGFYTTAGLLAFEMGDGANNLFCAGTTTLNDGDWHFVAVTLDRDLPGGLRLWVDGVLDGVCNPTTVPGSMFNTLDVTFGGDPLIPNPAPWFDGTIDEIEIFRRALTIADVEGIFRAGNAGKCPLGACEDSTGVPVCEGDCPQGQACLDDPFGILHCSCQDVPPDCGGSFPQCFGDCPPNQVCSMDATGIECICIDDVPQMCGDVQAPECNGDCPNANDICEEVPGTPFCECIPPTNPTCEESPYPTCGGDCPAGLECVTGPAQDCYCAQPVTCGDTFYPECNGPCPTGQTCENIVGTDNCECEDIPQSCSGSQYPECDGSCPANQTCKDVVIAGGAVDCQCKPCIVVEPNDDIAVKFSAAKDELRWSTAECALTYNTYRGEGPLLLDLDRDGLADDYGSCYQSEVIGTRSPAPGAPLSGQTHWYLITGENLVGESSLGTNSQGAARPNTATCP